MLGGTTTRVALSALIAASGAVLISASAATAADLGGGCCADLEERIAVLEATAAWKSNRKVSLTISGQVTKAVMFWDDGLESKASVVDYDGAQSSFLGKAKIDDKRDAGYLLEIGLDAASSGSVTHLDPSATASGTSGGTTGIEVHHAR